jgi:hypothetical protein
MIMGENENRNSTTAALRLMNMEVRYIRRNPVATYIGTR